MQPGKTCIERNSGCKFCTEHRIMGRRVKVEPVLKAEPVEQHVKMEEATSLKGSKGKSVKRERDIAPDIDAKAKRSRAETLADPFPHHKRPTPDECRVCATFYLCRYNRDARHMIENPVQSAGCDCGVDTPAW